MDQFIQFLVGNNQTLILSLGVIISLICLVWFFVVYRSVKLDVINPATNNIQALKLREDITKKNKELERMKHRFENQQKKIEELQSVDNSPDNQLLSDLKKEIDELKGKLSDYEIIEDDLADLSKFKEENAKLLVKLSTYEGKPQPKKGMVDGPSTNQVKDTDQTNKVTEDSVENKGIAANTAAPNKKEDSKNTKADAKA